MSPNPIFIIGTERSGSNLLRLLLNAHSNIAIPHPPHVMRDMSSFEGSYGDLTDEKRLNRLTGDMALLVNTHFAPWPFKIDGEDLARSTSVRSLYGVYASLYELFLRHTGKKRWGCKSTFMYRHIDQIRQSHKSPRFLHLVRDPRDVAASAQQSIFSRYHPYCQARLWCEQQEEIEAASGRDILRVRYEDLVNQPEQELKRVMAFLDEDYMPSQLQYFRGPEAENLSKLNESWRNCAVPVSAKSVGSYRSRLSPQEIDWVESVAHDLMKAYGYKPSRSTRAQGPSWDQLAGIALKDRVRMMVAESRSLFRDKNFVLRWKKWILLQYLKLIRSMDNGWGTGKNQNF